MKKNVNDEFWLPILIYMLEAEHLKTDSGDKTFLVSLFYGLRGIVVWWLKSMWIDGYFYWF